MIRFFVPLYSNPTNQDITKIRAFHTFKKRLYDVEIRTATFFDIPSIIESFASPYLESGLKKHTAESHIMILGDYSSKNSTPVLAEKMLITKKECLFNQNFLMIEFSKVKKYTDTITGYLTGLLLVNFNETIDFMRIKQGIVKNQHGHEKAGIRVGPWVKKDSDLSQQKLYINPYGKYNQPWEISNDARRGNYF